MNAKKSKMYHYLLMRKGICLLFFILLILKGAGGSLFALVMSSLVDCAGKIRRNCLPRFSEVFSS